MKPIIQPMTGITHTRQERRDAIEAARQAAEKVLEAKQDNCWHLSVEALNFTMEGLVKRVRCRDCMLEKEIDQDG